MPLLIPIFTESEEAEATPRFSFAGLFSVTVQSQPVDTLFAAVEVTTEGEEEVLNASADTVTGDSVVCVIDLVAEDLR